ncbi:MAG: phosphate signaling complex protein PhoU [Desulfobacterales bacterium]|nr:phosphate signaling complex protein PhoU [Desulfobacterales bacterium]
MPMRLHKELEKMKKMILSLGTMVEERVFMAIRAINEKDPEIAKIIIKSDYEIDNMEVEVEEECLKILALHQPVAVDLRFLIAIIKINNDLERIADEAVNIAKRMEILTQYENLDFAFDFSFMAEKAAAMLKKSLDALVNLDPELAFEVCRLDDEIDKLDYEVYGMVKNTIGKDCEHVEFYISKLLISRYLERIADHATNIAEEVIYLIQGEIIRHGHY